jgi:Ni2+-binding GTPase involved in maturation of urease and hydrogenase
MSRSGEAVVVERIRRQLDEKNVIALQLCGRTGSGKTSLVEHLASSLHDLDGVGVVTPALPQEAAPVATVHEVGVWRAQGVSHLTPEVFLELLEEMPLGALDYLFLEENRDPSCKPPTVLGCHARGLLFPVIAGLQQIEEAAEAIQRCHFILITQCDRMMEADFDIATARAIIHEINEAIPVFFLSHEEHSDWLEWLAYLDGLRRAQHQHHVVAEPAAELYIG